MYVTIGALALLATMGTEPGGESMCARFEQAMFGDHRSEQNIARNRYRHPVGTLQFFGVGPGMDVLEIWPGGGWYSEILAPSLRNIGTFIVASYDPDIAGQPDYRYRLHQSLLDKFKANPDLYDQVEVVEFSPPESASLGEAESVDIVLTFRNMHGWVSDGVADQIFAEFHRVLRPGGILGVVQHRADTGAPAHETASSGYLSEDAVIEIARKAGFTLDAKSEINANPKDTHDHPEGVWTLPPSLRLGDQDQAKYEAIGESDRMTLRFVKPKA